MKKIICFLLFVTATYSFNPYSIQNKNNCIITSFEQVNSVIKNCTNIVIRDLTVPGGVQLSLQLLNGTALSFSGRNTFNVSNWNGPLVDITGSYLTISGEAGHVIYGKGELYWDGVGSWGSKKPKFFRLSNVSNSVIKNLHFKNAPMHGFSIKGCANVTLSNIFIDNSEGDPGVAELNHEGHNTDGFGISNSTNIVIKDSTVYNQDDCVAVNSGSHILVEKLLCHGSHGLSISVGIAGTFEDNSVTNLTIRDSVIIDAMTGIHIKTRLTYNGTGIIKDVTYKNIFMIGSYNFGLSVEQNYTNTPANETGSGALPSAHIPIQGLILSNVRGTVLNSSVPYYIVCAQGGCSDWTFEDVNVYGLLGSACVNYHPDGLECDDYVV